MFASFFTRQQHFTGTAFLAESLKTGEWDEVTFGSDLTSSLSCNNKELVSLDRTQIIERY